jgi:hypothetical protein
MMQPRIKMGLAIGTVGLALNICVSGFIGFCGPLVSLIAGGAAGFLAALQEKVPFGEVPTANSDPALMVGYYLGGIGTGLCFGIVGAILAAGVGAGAGYMVTQEQPSANTPM